MLVQGVDGSAERTVIIGLCTNSAFLARLTPAWGREPLRSRAGNLIASWCVRHFTQYREAPNRAILGYYEDWARADQDVDTAKNIMQLLAYLSEESDRSSQALTFGYLIDLAANLLNEVRLERLKEDLDKTLRVGDVTNATKLASDFRPVSLKADTGVDVLRDREARKRALNQQANTLIRYDGGAGSFFQDQFSENSFVAFVGMPKGGKSYYQLDAAWRAMRQGRKVAYFQIGDMSEAQIMERFIVRAVGRPLAESQVYYPDSLVVGADYASQVSRRPLTFRGSLTEQRIDSVFAKLQGDLRLKYHPAGTVTINDIRNTLEQWDSEDWRAKVVIVDYLENLAPTNPRDDPVKQVGETWQAARIITETRNCSLITGHQTNKEGFKPGLRVLTRANFRGSLMVLAHVTAMIGINQTDEESDKGVARLNYIVRRRGQFTATKCCVVAQCLSLARPIVQSYYQP